LTSRTHRDEKTDAPVVLVEWYDWTKWLLERVDNFPKNQRFIFGQRLADRSICVLEILVDASYRSKKADLLAERRGPHQSADRPREFHLPRGLSNESHHVQNSRERLLLCNSFVPTGPPFCGPSLRAKLSEYVAFLVEDLNP
jgi:hypothetical protein